MSARMRQEELKNQGAALGALAARLRDVRGEGDLAAAVVDHARAQSDAGGVRLSRVDRVADERVLAETGQCPGSPTHSAEVGEDLRWRLSVWGGETPADDSLEATLSLATVCVEREALRRELDLRDARDARLECACDAVGAPSGPVEAARRIAAAARVLLEADGAALLPGVGEDRFPVAWDGADQENGESLPGVPRASARMLAAGTLWSGEVDADDALAEHGFATAAAAPIGSHCTLLVAFRGDEPLARSELDLLRLFAERASLVLEIADRSAAAGQIAAMDEPTGLYNGPYFRSRLEQETSRAMRARGALSVLSVGLPTGADGTVPESFLSQVVSELGASLRAMDVACRLAADELAVILPDLDGMAAFMVGERLRAIASDDPSEPRVAVGVASFPDQAGSAGELARNAARALAWARHHGGDRTFLYDRDVALGLRAEQERRDDHEAEALTALHAIAGHIDARSGAGNHSRNVGRISGLIARQLEIPPDHAERVRTAGVLHDVGKLGVGSEILLKQEPLTELDREELRQHSQIGERMISGAELGDIREWVLYHHENMDGSGYPEGRRGNDIPLESRIIAVAEAFDVMLHDSPYRPAFTPDQALDELRRCAGDQFDPTVVDALLELVDRGVPGVMPS